MFVTKEFLCFIGVHIGVNETHSMIEPVLFATYYTDSCDRDSWIFSTPEKS